MSIRTTASSAPAESSVAGILRLLKRVDYLSLLFVLGTIAFALALRYVMLDFKSVDFQKYTRLWYGALKDGGFSAFGTNFANYNMPYLYLLYTVIRFFPDLPAVIATKVPSLAADFLMAWLAFRIVRLRYGGSLLPAFAAAALLFAPTIVLNSALWGQADALYTSALVACLYFVLVRRDPPALIAFGVAAAFKAQGFFLLPFLVALALKRRVRWQDFLLVPVVLFVAVVPAWLAGRPLLELLLIYPSQAAQYETLAMQAASMLAMIPDSGRYYPYFYPAGLLAAAAALLVYCAVVWRSRIKLEPDVIVELAVISVMLLPFLLPKMHDRYFYAADVMTILLAFYRPRLYFVPIMMSLVSFFSYQPTLFQSTPVPFAVLALVVLFLLVVLVRDAIIRLFPSAKETPDAVEWGA